VRHYFSENALAYFEPNSPASIAQQMMRLYSDAQLRINLAWQARQAYEPIRWSIMRDRYLELIDRLACSNQE
jgi:hypothetical protein